MSGAVRIIEELAKKGDPYPLRQRNQLFRNNGQSCFEEVSQQAGFGFGMSEVSRGAAFGDVDNDGDTDVMIFKSNGPTRLMMNQECNRNNWLGVCLLHRDQELEGL